eukprot:3599408-Alexandrium_andersonii.AAC.1
MQRTRGTNCCMRTRTYAHTLHGDASTTEQDSEQASHGKKLQTCVIAWLAGLSDAEQLANATAGKKAVC